MIGELQGGGTEPAGAPGVAAWDQHEKAVEMTPWWLTGTMPKDGHAPAAEACCDRWACLESAAAGAPSIVHQRRLFRGCRARITFIPPVAASVADFCPFTRGSAQRRGRSWSSPARRSWAEYWPRSWPPCHKTARWWSSIARGTGPASRRAACPISATRPEPSHPARGPAWPEGMLIGQSYGAAIATLMRRCDRGAWLRGPVSSYLGEAGPPLAGWWTPFTPQRRHPARSAPRGDRSGPASRPDDPDARGPLPPDRPHPRHPWRRG